MTTKELSTKQAWQAKDLARFNFKVKYRLGVENLVDRLLRRPNYA